MQQLSADLPDPHAHVESDCGPAVTQFEADSIATNLDLDHVDHIHVHWVEGFEGLARPLLHPIHKAWVRGGWLACLTVTSLLA